MEIYCIWVRNHGELWLENAWDGINADEHNPDGFKADVAKAVNSHGYDAVRVQKVRLPYDKVEALFDAPMLDLTND